MVRPLVFLLVCTACQDRRGGTVTPSATAGTGDTSVPVVAAAFPGPVGRAMADTLADVEILGYRIPDQGGIVAGEGVALGDLDGDGRAEPIVGAAGWTDASTGVPNRGAAFVTSSAELERLCTADPKTGVPTCALDADPANYSVRLAGSEVAGAAFGRGLATGDLDADGIVDLVVGAVGANEVSIWYGRADLAFGALPDVIISGPATAGQAVAVLPDLNGDQCPDLGIGANEASDTLGGVYVVYSMGAKLGCGRWPAAIDLAAGEYDVHIVGSVPLQFAGTAVSSAGDFDGDGAGDLLVGAPDAIQGINGAGPGDVWLLYGGLDARELASCPSPCEVTLADFGASGSYDAVRFTLEPSLADHWLGRSATGVGDATGDRCDDVLLAAMKYTGTGTFQTGSVYLVDGAGVCDGSVRWVSDEVVLDGSGDDFVLQIVGDSFDDKLGEAVSGAGDVNGDGFSDFVIGEYRDDEQGMETDTNSGAAYLVYGGWPGLDQVAPATVVFGSQLCDADGVWPSSVPPHLKLYGTAELEAFGKLVSGGGDANADGFDDLLIGAPRWGSTDASCEKKDGVCDKGAAFLFHGGPPEDGGCLDQ